MSGIAIPVTLKRDSANQCTTHEAIEVLPATGCEMIAAELLKESCTAHLVLSSLTSKCMRLLQELPQESGRSPLKWLDEWLDDSVDAGNTAEGSGKHAETDGDSPSRLAFANNPSNPASSYSSESRGNAESLRDANVELAWIKRGYAEKEAELSSLKVDLQNIELATDACVLLLDQHLRIRRFTPRMAEIFQLTLSDLRRPIETFAHHLSFDSLAAQIRTVATQKTSFHAQVVHRTGQHFSLSILSCQIDPGIDGVMLALKDTNDLVTAQRAASTALQRLERILSASTDGIWDWPDVHKEQMWWSPECYRLIGYEPGEIPSTYSTWVNHIHPVDRKLMNVIHVDDNQKCYFETQRELEYRLRQKSGEYRWYRHRVLVEYDEDQRVARMSGAVRGVHLRKLAEIQAQTETHRRYRFMAMLSHELRKPMATMLNNLELGNESVETPDRESSNALTTAQQQLKYSVRLLDNLLEIATFQMDKMAIRKHRIDLAGIAQEVFQRVESQFESKRQNLKSTLPDGPVIVIADQERIIQCQLSLLANASIQSHELADIFYDLFIDDGFAVITIRDQGCGIADDDLEQVFDLSLQPDSSSDSKNVPMGVQLALAKCVIDAHGGTIEAMSDGVGKGSTFTIRLPLSSDVACAETKLSNASTPLQPTSFRRRVMLVEDDIDVLRAMSKHLAYYGLIVASASDGFSALEVFEKSSPEVAILDIGLPGMDGYELAQEIRARDRTQSTLIIALTGHGRDRLGERCNLQIFDHFLLKPARIDHIVALIDAHFKRKACK